VRKRGGEGRGGSLSGGCQMGGVEMQIGESTTPGGKEKFKGLKRGGVLGEKKNKRKAGTRDQESVHFIQGGSFWKEASS